jgi:peptidoglycan lytic transglycosylase
MFTAPVVAVAAAIHHHHHRRRRMRSALASWYDDQGQTACGFHARYGFASLFLPCGARVTMRGPGGTVTATSQDRGPYVAGRTFDLNAALKQALGCSDLCTIKWRLG